MVGRTNVGGGSGSASTAWAYIGVEYPSGSVCTATNGTTTLTAADTSGAYVFEIPQPSSVPESWTVSCTNGTKNKSQTVSISTQYQCEVITLSYSRLPTGYQEVEYLESTNGNYQYINTGMEYVYGEEYEYDIKFMITADNDGFVCGCYMIGSSTYNLYFNVTSDGYDSTAYHRFHYAKVQIPFNMTSSAPKTEVGVLYDMQMMTSDHTLCINGTDYSITTISSGNAGYIPFLFCMNVNGSASYFGACRIYSYTRKNNSTNEVYQNLVPCYRTSDNVAGMYDLVSDTFLTNAGSGTFAVGADV